MPVDKAYLLELVALRNECVEYQTRIDIAISPHQTIFAPLEKIATIEENLKFAPVHTQLFRAFLTDLYKKPLFKGKLVSIPDITRSTAGDSIATVNDLDFRKYAHLFACRIILTQAINTLEAEIATLKSQLDKEETQAKKELDNAVKEKKTEEKDSNQTSLIGQNKQTPTQADAEQKVTAIRDTKKEMLARNKEAFLNYCKHHNIKLDGLDLKTLDTIAFNKSIVRTSEASFFTSMVENNPRLKQKLQKDENLRKLAHGYVNDKADLLKSGRSLRAAGYTINIGDDTAGGTELLTQLNNASKDIQRFGFSQEMVETAFTSSGKDIDDEIKSLQASEDKDAKSRLKELQTAKKYRAEIIKGSYWSDDSKKRDEIWKENELFQDAATPEELPLSEDELPTFLDDRSLLEMMGSQEPTADESVQTNAPAQTNTPVQPAGEQRQKKGGGISASDIKRAKQVGQIAQKIASNPVAMGALGVGAGVGISFAAGLSQGLAAAAGAGTIALPAGIAGGAYLGGALGSVFGPLGTVVGAFVGGLGGATVAGLTSLSVNIGGYSIAAQTGHLLYGIPLNTTQLLGGNAATIAPTIQATLPALGNLGTATAANAAATLAPTGAGIAQSASAAAINGIGGAINVGSKFLAALPNAGTLFTSVGSIGTLVVAPLAATAVVAILSNSSLMSSFLSDDTGSTKVSESKYVTVTKTATKDVYQNSDLPITNPPIHYKITITPKDEYQVTIKAATDTYSLLSKGSPAAIPDQDVSSFVSSEVLPKTGRTFEYDLSVPDQSYIDTKITNSMQITFDVSGPETATGETATGVQAIIIGNPPDDVGCLKFGPGNVVISTSFAGGDNVTTKEWTEEEKQIVIKAFTTTAPYTTYRRMLCQVNGVQQDVTLYRASGSNYGGFTSGARGLIVMYDLSLKYGYLDTLYTLTHETGHIISARNGAIVARFGIDVWDKVSHPVAGGESYLKSYTYVYQCGKGTCGANTAAEDFAETIGVFFTYKHRTYIINDERVHIEMPTDYPIHFNWAEKTYFDSIEAP